MNVHGEYIPIPVDVARKIADVFDKDMVIIVSWDSAFRVTHCTTYGRSARCKAAAAAAGEEFMKHLGCDLARSEYFEDFRNLAQAEATEMIERLTAEVADLKRQLQDGIAGDGETA